VPFLALSLSFCEGEEMRIGDKTRQAVADHDAEKFQQIVEYLRMKWSMKDHEILALVNRAVPMDQADFEEFIQEGEAQHV
jgi:hypothetical protein